MGDELNTDNATPEGEAPAETIDSIAEGMGWNPNFEGAEGKERLSAADYIKKGRTIQSDMRDSLKTQKKMIKDLTTSVKNIQSHTEKVGKAEIAKLRTQLKKEKEEAIIDGDVDAVEKIDGKMDDLKEQEAETKSDKKSGDAEFKAWHKDNSWYGTDLDMSDYANYVSGVEQRKNPNIEPSELMEKTTERVKKKFPEYFGKAPKEKAKPKTAVNEAGSRPGTSSKNRYTKADLSEDQRQVMRSFVSAGIMTEQKYIDDLASTGELG